MSQEAPASHVGSVLPRLSVKRPVTVIMGLLAMLVTGVIAYTRIPLQLNPSNFDFPFLYAVVPYANANPMEIENSIARPVERQLSTVRNLAHVTSWSQPDRLGVFMQFQQDTDMALAYREVQDRLDRVMPELPSEVERTFLYKFNPNDDPVVWMGIALDEENEDSYALLRDRVVRRLERVEGVAKVELYGIEEPYFLIDLDNDASRAHGVDLQGLYQMLRGGSFAMASGEVTQDGRRLLVRSLSQFETVADLENLVVPRWAGERMGRMDDPTEHVVRLKDVATVYYGSPLPREIVHVDGREGLSVGVYKESTANTVAICARVTDVIDRELRKDPHLEGLDLNVYFDEGEIILASLGTLKQTGLIGGVFAVGVLLFFLGRLRLTIVIALAIPLSLLMSLTVMYFTGETMNLVSLMGMLVAVGLVVDCPIVVLENIHRRRAMGEGPVTAAARGAAEVALAVTMGTLTTVVVFLPIILMPGNAIMKYFMSVFGLPICYTILASLLVALVLIPLATVYLPFGTGTSRLRSVTDRLYDRLLSPFQRLLSRISTWGLENRLALTVGLIVVFMMGMSLGGLVKSSDDTEGNIRNVELWLRLPPGLSRTDVEETMTTVEKAILAHAEELDVRSIYSEGDSGSIDMDVFLKLAHESDVTVPQVEEKLKEILPPLPGVEVRYGDWNMADAPKATSVVLRGDDTARLAALAKEVERRLMNADAITAVDTNLQEGTDEVRVRVDRDLIRSYGVGVQAVTGIVSTTLRGAPLPDYHVGGRQVPMRFRLSPENRRTVHQLEAMPVPANTGEEIALGAFTEFEYGRGLPWITRRDGRTQLRVTAKTEEVDIQELSEQVDAVMAGMEFPEGYGWDKGGRFSIFAEGEDNASFALIMSIAFIFILMGVLFESWLLPLSVMLSIPFAFTGINVVLAITQTPRDILANIGTVLLVGIVVNNAIVLVDCINRHRRTGLERTEAIRRALDERFRPIIMTALTTLFGVLPMAIGGTEIVGIPFAPLGRVIFGGLLTSTASTIIAVPLFYAVFDDLARWFKSFRAWRAGLPGLRRLTGAALARAK